MTTTAAAAAGSTNPQTTAWAGPRWSTMLLPSVADTNPRVIGGGGVGGGRGVGGGAGGLAQHCSQPL